MSFLHRLRERLAGTETRISDIEISRRAEKIIQVVESGAFDTIIQEILDPMERESFEAFKKLPPEETLSILQAQKVAQVVDQIKKRVLSIVEEGRAAAFRVQNSTLEEGE